MATITWTEDVNEGLTRARNEQKPALVDFTAAPM
jgi:hypothetical protein